MSSCCLRGAFLVVFKLENRQRESGKVSMLTKINTTESMPSYTGCYQVPGSLKSLATINNPFLIYSSVSCIIGEELVYSNK
jgi:hypothetical protein